MAAMAAEVSAGHGLSGLCRAAAAALGAPLALLDRAGIVLAVAGATRAEEEKLTAGGGDVTRVGLRLGDEVVGEARMLGEPADPEPAGVLAALAALEVERARSEEWSGEAEVAAVVDGILDGSIDGADAVVARAAEVGADLGRGAGVLMVRAHAGSAQAGEWRARVFELVVRGLRAAAPGSIAAPGAGPGAEVRMIVPAPSEERVVRAAEALDRDLPRSLPGYVLTISRSRHASGPAEIARAGQEARLALNVGEAESRSPLAFEDTGSYRLLLGTGSEELRSFYAETVEPLAAYDEQYETDLVATVEAYLDSDGNVPATAKQMFTHRHTIRYRLERVRDLSGHDATETEGRERLSLGIKAMRVMGIAPPRGRSRD